MLTMTFHRKLLLLGICLCKLSAAMSQIVHVKIEELPNFARELCVIESLDVRYASANQDGVYQITLSNSKPLNQGFKHIGLTVTTHESKSAAIAHVDGFPSKINGGTHSRKRLNEGENRISDHCIHLTHDPSRHVYNVGFSIGSQTIVASFVGLPETSVLSAAKRISRFFETDGRAAMEAEMSGAARKSPKGETKPVLESDSVPNP